MRLIATLILSVSATMFAADRYVCHLNPPSAPACSTYSPLYATIDAAVTAASYGDRILIVPQSGSSPETGHVGAYCGGNDDCTRPTTIALKSGLTMTTS